MSESEFRPDIVHDDLPHKAAGLKESDSTDSVLRRMLIECTLRYQA